MRVRDDRMILSVLFIDPEKTFKQLKVKIGKGTVKVTMGVSLYG